SVCGSSAARGVAPETCAIHGPGSIVRATSAIVVSGTQSRTRSAFSTPTATPRSSSRAETADPTRPAPMTLTVSNTSSSSSVADTGHRKAYRAAGTLAIPVGRRLILGMSIAAALFAPAQARAAIPLTSCGPTGVQCGTVVVPLDRSGQTPGTVSLHVEMLPAETQAVGVM